jgi:hypothetical protein
MIKKLRNQLYAPNLGARESKKKKDRPIPRRAGIEMSQFGEDTAIFTSNKKSLMQSTTCRYIYIYIYDLESGVYK